MHPNSVTSTCPILGGTVQGKIPFKRDLELGLHQTTALRTEQLQPPCRVLQPVE